MAQNLGNIRALKMFQERHPQMVAELAALSGRGGLAGLDVFAIKLIAKCVLLKDRKFLFSGKNCRVVALLMRCVDKQSERRKIGEK
ncbi:hypothetical protein [Polaromonas sp. JS666]|uniref:hypothetical protein n=1 Tax=Polaromonas sp. (strain JS666 / ATCC BAA-500) TaxID=296591 RepID=UPI0000535E03|nr:hypothetical protein [Polaromonas sp. JS666]